MDLIDGLIGALGSVGDAIAQVLIELFTLIVEVFQFIWSVLQIVGNFFFTLLQDVGSFFQHIWDNFFKGIFTSILKGVVKFGQWLHNIFAPVVKFLTKVSKYIDRIYNHYVKPILKIIRIARVFLQLLRALGIKWAGQLDKILGTVQNDIQRAFLVVKGYINTIVDLLNIVSDPSKLLRRPTTLLSLRRVLHASIRQFTGLPPGFFVPQFTAGSPNGLGFISKNFDPNSAIDNPPASYYLQFDGGVQDFGFLGDGETIDDGAVDDVTALGFFTADPFADENCTDSAQCMSDACRTILGAK